MKESFSEKLKELKFKDDTRMRPVFIPVKYLWIKDALDRAGTAMFATDWPGAVIGSLLPGKNKEEKEALRMFETATLRLRNSFWENAVSVLELETKEPVTSSLWADERFSLYAFTKGRGMGLDVPGQKYEGEYAPRECALIVNLDELDTWLGVKSNVIMKKTEISPVDISEIPIIPGPNGGYIKRKDAARLLLVGDSAMANWETMNFLPAHRLGQRVVYEFNIIKAIQESGIYPGKKGWVFPPKNMKKSG